MTDASTHIFRVALQDSPSVYREIEIGSQATLNELAKAIIEALDFEFDHPFGFYSNLNGPAVMRPQVKYELFADLGEKTDAQSVRKTRVTEAFPNVGHTMLFISDY